MVSQTYGVDASGVFIVYCCLLLRRRNQKLESQRGQPQGPKIEAESRERR